MTILDGRYRSQVLQDINEGENKYRKDRSYKQYRVMTNDYEQYVAEKLAGQLDPSTVIEMAKISSINVAEKVVNKTAVVYKKAPKRSYTNISDEDEEILEKIHKDGRFNAKFRASNRAFKYQYQNLLQIIPKKGKLVMKSLKLHQYDVIPMDDDPEKAKTYILSIHDRELVDQERFYVNQEATGDRGSSEVHRETRDYRNSTVADEDDYKAVLERYVVWDLETKTNFIMNGAGAIKDPETGEFVPEVTPDLLEKITSDFIVETGMLPFIDVSEDKDFTYFIRNNHSVTDFTIEFNAALSDYADTNHMQSKSQAIIKGPADLIATEMVIGSHVVLKLVNQTDEQGNEIKMDFDYVNPNPDMAGAKEFIEALLALYLSSRDVDSSEITTKAQNDRYSSGFERFLAIFETFSASQEDFDTYDLVEHEKFQIMKGWINLAKNSKDLLDPKYITTSNLEDVEQNVEFYRPEEVRSTMQKLEEVQKKLELGLTSRVKAYSKLHNMDESQALDVIREIDQQEQLVGVSETEIQQEEERPEVQS